MCSSRGEVSRAGVWPTPLRPSPYTLPKIASLLLPVAPWNWVLRRPLVRSEVEFQVGILGLRVPEERLVLHAKCLAYL